MIRIVLLVLASSVYGRSFRSRPVLYQTRENDAITIRWDSQTKTDLSLTNLICVSRLNSLKVLYQMVKGLEAPESSHQQFSRRVLLDRDALKEGRVRLHMFLITAEDSGDYWCHLSANYNEKTRRWGVQATVYFVLNVTQNSVEVSTNEGATWLQDGPTLTTAVLITVVLLTSLMTAALLVTCRGSRREVSYEWRPEKSSVHGSSSINTHKQALA